MQQEDLLDDNFFETEYEYDVSVLRTGNFIILYLATFTLYATWWQYKQWRFFKEKDNSDIMPIPRAIFTIFFLHGLFDRIQDFAFSNGYRKEYSSTGLFMAVIVLSLTSRLPGWLSSLSFCGFVGFLPPLKALNYALRGDELTGVDLSEFNWRQWSLILFGGALVLSAFLGVLPKA